MKGLLHSLRGRLLLGFTLITQICWGIAAFGAWYETRDKINALFDTQQMLFAKRLASLPASALEDAAVSLPKTKRILKDHRGEQDDDALAFAIFSPDGQRLLDDGEKGRDIRFSDERNGFRNQHLGDDDDRWRIVWLNSENNAFRVAVGQEWDYREDMTGDIVFSNLQPWLYAMPLLWILLYAVITREIAPLKKITQQLGQRQPDETRPMLTPRLPTEVQPMVKALNHLFARTGEQMQRERRFTSDAAHELRSPLAALKVQTEVVQLAANNPDVRQHALQQLNTGIDRATRLVDQLLTLSRLDDSPAALTQETVDLHSLTQQQIASHYPAAEQAGISLALHAEDKPIMRQGYPLLLSLLLRNLLENALRYCPAGSQIDVTLTPRGWVVEDNGPGVSESDLARLGERFWRPPGQEMSGSGLGLSIVQQIAQLHGMRVRFEQRKWGGFKVIVQG
ncbi:two-component system sensor histidine kinase QseC [Enterobacterales bacterium CwR94]|nr:two-component system sensor histidine kinase QseC [Enterobacterales bacterium CwR94]